jgi:hypothetical protein
MKWLSSLLSMSVIPDEAARRRVRRSRVGLIWARVLMLVCSSGKRLVFVLRW